MSGIYNNNVEDKYFENKLLNHLENSELSVDTSIEFDDYQFKLSGCEFSVSGTVEIVNNSIGQIVYTEVLVLGSDDWEVPTDGLKTVAFKSLDNCPDFAEYLFNKL